MLCTYTIFKVQVYALSVEMCNFWTIIINLDHALNLWNASYETNPLEYISLRLYLSIVDSYLILSVVIPYSTINEIPDAKKPPWLLYPIAINWINKGAKNEDRPCLWSEIFFAKTTYFEKILGLLMKI